MSDSLVTATQNYLSPQRFAFVIDTPKYKELSYECQTVSLGALSVPEVEVPYRNFNTKMTADRINFDNFDANFLIDENMDNYNAIYEWAKYQVLDNDPERMKSNDVILIIYNNNNQSNIRIHYINAFPVSLSPLEFDTTKTNTEYFIASVSFAYDYYEIRNVR